MVSLGGEGRGEGPLPGGEGGGCFPNECGVRGGEGTPRVHGQARASRLRFLAKRGVRVPIFVLRVGVRVSFRGAKHPPNSYRFRCLFGPRSDFGSGFGAYPGAPPTVGRGSEPGTDCPTCFRYRGEGERNGPRLYPLVSLPWRRAANPAPNVPPIFATVGSGPDCTEGAFGPRKGGYPLSHVSYSRRRTGTSPLPGPPVAALVWVRCGAWGAIRETPALRSVPRRTSRTASSDVRGASLGPSVPRSLGPDRILVPCVAEWAHPRIAPVPLGSLSDLRERLLGYPRSVSRFKWGLFCIRGEPRASERAAEPRNSPYIVRARHPSRRDVVPRSTRSGRRKPPGSATLGGERPTRRASIPCWTSCGAQTELGGA